MTALQEAAGVEAEVVGKPTWAFFELALKTLVRDGVNEADWKDVAVVSPL